MFLPTTREEMKELSWDRLDVIIVTGDTYIDSPYIGAAVIGKVLQAAGYKVGIIAQPDTEGEKDITRLGEPALFWGVTAGSVDSMVANYTALKKRRSKDDFTPGGKNTKRPDRAAIIYSNLIRKYFKNTAPIVLGGIEASLRRIAHYDYWDDKIRRALLFDAKADILVYGMGEKSVLKLAGNLKTGKDWKDIRGICYISPHSREEYIILPSYQEVKGDKKKFISMFHTFYLNNDPLTAKGLCQQQDSRYLIQNPPSHPLVQKELDKVHDLLYEREVHPYYRKDGKVKALETIKFSITTHRGCYGECNFCSISVHQGRVIQGRSEKSILREAKILTKLGDFKGYILDVGGPTANMYGIECQKKLKSGSCTDKRCLYPQICPSLKINHKKQMEILNKIRRIEGVKKVFVSSGIRYDMLLSDQKYGERYLRELVKYHISGQLKIAPEHTENNVLEKMGKPSQGYLKRFRDKFLQINKEQKKKQFLTYYLIAAHPGCRGEDMYRLKEYTSKELKLNPEQVQIFTPTPSTYSTLMYYTEIDPFSGKAIYAEKNLKKKEKQKMIVIEKKNMPR
ncbi:YgiQ family radical SAM protein [Candidatus Atribacteria bacterium RBG_19FT_COMBO_35_14]|uniref:YgiQ family radical SAM protein n=1 Tax=Candidatus Sediminicultor quintus TaxID=1797291 RepID=A0A1F5A7C9_9BACT|nr:MAG: YgiQ family radical SAM protein [Candidatus Atribacteria bacterium RBG_19FT_COMBO_35_14]